MGVVAVGAMRHLVLLGVCGLLAACSEGTTDGDAGDAGSVDSAPADTGVGPGDVGGAPDAGTADTGAGLGDAGSAADAGTTDSASIIYGEIVLQQVLTIDQGQERYETTLRGKFTREPERTLAGCTTTMEGSCRFRVCDDVETNAEIVGAGTLTVRGGELASTVTVTPGPDGLYSADIGGRAFSGTSERIDFEWTGDTAPAERGAVAIPATVLLVSPIGGTVPRSADLELQWGVTADPGSGVVTLRVTQSSGASESTLFCSYPPGDGAATIPASLLGRFSVGGANAKITVLRDVLVPTRGTQVVFEISTQLQSIELVFE